MYDRKQRERGAENAVMSGPRVPSTGRYGRHRGKPVPRLDTRFDLLLLALLLLPRRVGREQSEVDVHGLEVGIGTGEVFGQGGQAGAVRPAEVLATPEGSLQHRGGIQAGGQCFGI